MLTGEAFVTQTIHIECLTLLWLVGNTCACIQTDVHHTNIIISYLFSSNDLLFPLTSCSVFTHIVKYTFIEVGR